MKNQWNNFIIIREEKSIRPIFFSRKSVSKQREQDNKERERHVSEYFFFQKISNEETISLEIIDLFAAKRIIGRGEGGWGEQRGRGDSEKVPSETNNVECPSCIIYSSVKIPGERAPSARISSHPINIFENIIFINNIFRQEFVSIHGNETRISW